MIPEFDDAGFLPQGVHEASWAEIANRFAGTPRRQQILKDVLFWLRHVQQAGSGSAYIDGSFVSAKPEPGDFDGCFSLDGVDKAKLHPCLLDRSPAGVAAIKATFGGDIRLDREYPPGSISPYVRFFQYDSRSSRKKGIVRVDLATVVL